MAYIIMAPEFNLAKYIDEVYDPDKYKCHGHELYMTHDPKYSIFNVGIEAEFLPLDWGTGRRINMKKIDKLNGKIVSNFVDRVSGDLNKKQLKYLKSTILKNGSYCANEDGVLEVHFYPFISLGDLQGFVDLMNGIITETSDGKNIIFSGAFEEPKEIWTTDVHVTVFGDIESTPETMLAQYKALRQNSPFIMALFMDSISKEKPEAYSSFRHVAIMSETCDSNIGCWGSSLKDIHEWQRTRCVAQNKRLGMYHKPDVWFNSSKIKFNKLTPIYDGKKMEIAQLYSIPNFNQKLLQLEVSEAVNPIEVTLPDGQLSAKDTVIAAALISGVSHVACEEYKKGCNNVEDSIFIDWKHPIVEMAATEYNKLNLIVNPPGEKEGPNVLYPVKDNLKNVNKIFTNGFLNRAYQEGTLIGYLLHAGMIEYLPVEVPIRKMINKIYPALEELGADAQIRDILKNLGSGYPARWQYSVLDSKGFEELPYKVHENLKRNEQRVGM